MNAKSRAINHVNKGYQGQMMYFSPTGHQTNQPSFFHHKPNAFHPPLVNRDWNPYPLQGSFYPQGFPPFAQNYQQGPVSQTPNQYYSQKDAQFLFQNPLQPKEEMIPKPYNLQMNGYPIMNPYPKQSFIPKQPSGMKSIMNSFKSQDGSVDFNKMVNTAGQMMNAMTQVSSLVKGFSGLFKT